MALLRVCQTVDSSVAAWWWGFQSVGERADERAGQKVDQMVVQKEGQRFDQWEHKEWC